MTEDYKPSAGEHPITPPPELVEKWLWSDDCSLGRLITITSNRLQDVATQAAQWGADQELEAWFAAVEVAGYPVLAASIRNTRRPQPPSLKEQALNDLDDIPTHDDEGHQVVDLSNIRRALEALDD